MSQVCLLFCHKLADRAGTTTQAIRLASALSTRYKVFLCGEGEIKLNHVKILSIKPTSSPLEFRKRAITKVNDLNLEKTDILLFQAFDPIYAGPTVLYLSKKYKQKSILRLGAVYEDFYASRIVNKIGIPANSKIRNIFSYIIALFLILTLQRYSNVYANCNFLALHYTKLTKRRIHSIPNIVQLKYSKSHNYKTKSESLRLLYVGRIEARKNVDDMILSIAKLKNKAPISKLTIVGSWNKEPWYGNIVFRLTEEKLGDWIPEINFPGFQSENELVKQYENHDLSLFPTNSSRFPITEGMPNVIIESLGYGVPVIATNVAGVYQILHPNLLDFIINPENIVDDMASKIEWFTTLNETEISNYRQMGIDKVKSYNRNRIISYYSKLFII